MHTIELQPDMFRLHRDGREASIAHLFPGWDEHDRFGIVVHGPYGAMGASLLIQAAIAQFFSFRHEHGLDSVPMYPEIFAFHVGGPHGDLSLYDFWPASKEVVVAEDPVAVIQAINDRGVTRLAVPDGPIEDPGLLWPEYGSAANRLRSCWLYSPDGSCHDADTHLQSSSEMAAANTLGTLDLAAYVADMRNKDVDAFERLCREDADFSRWLARTVERAEEVPRSTREALLAQLLPVLAGGTMDEEYRCVDVRTALGRLVPAQSTG